MHTRSCTLGSHSVIVHAALGEPPEDGEELLGEEERGESEKDRETRWMRGRECSRGTDVQISGVIIAGGACVRVCASARVHVCTNARGI